MRRRDFISIAGSAAAWPVAAHAQQAGVPVVALVRDGSADTAARYVAAFRKGLNDTGYVEGQNVNVEYHWLEGRYDRLPAILADLVRREVTVIATPGQVPSMATKAAAARVPVVFGVGEDPVHLGLVASLARPGGNATGVNFFVSELAAKRLRLLHDLIPNAVRIAVLFNPMNPSVESSTLPELQEAAPSLGLQIKVVKASSIGEIDATFASFSQDRPDALFVGGDAFFLDRRVQFAILTARDRIPATYSIRETVTAGGLMSYGPDLAEVFRQIGIYTARILQGAKPAELPVVQSTKLEFALNLGTARALGIKISDNLLSLADEVIE
jgi:putative ABC transport system substrate-binding protein